MEPTRPKRIKKRIAKRDTTGDVTLEYGPLVHLNSAKDRDRDRETKKESVREQDDKERNRDRGRLGDGFGDNQKSSDRDPATSTDGNEDVFSPVGDVKTPVLESRVRVDDRVTDLNYNRNGVDSKRMSLHSQAQRIKSQRKSLIEKKDGKCY